jgi:hypothetical protein
MGLKLKCCNLFHAYDHVRCSDRSWQVVDQYEEHEVDCGFFVYEYVACMQGYEGG